MIDPTPKPDVKHEDFFSTEKLIALLAPDQPASPAIVRAARQRLWELDDEIKRNMTIETQPKPHVSDEELANELELLAHNLSRTGELNWCPLYEERLRLAATRLRELSAEVERSRGTVVAEQKWETVRLSTSEDGIAWGEVRAVNVSELADKVARLELAVVGLANDISAHHGIPMDGPLGDIARELDAKQERGTPNE